MLRASSIAGSGPIPFDIVVLTHDERHLRRRVLTLQHGDEVLVDLPEAAKLRHGARLVLDDGRRVEVIAAEEDLIEIRTSDAAGLIEIAWHLGNRHTPAQIEPHRILVAQDHVLADMLRTLGADPRSVSEPFEPTRGAYHRHPQAHAHNHQSNHDH